MPSSVATPEAQPDRLLTREQLAEFLQISIRQVDRLRSDGRLPSPFYVSESRPRWSRRQIQEHLGL